ncbi:MAG: hypothetical protein V3R33_05485 [Anaerolineales bacterium]
MRKSINLLLLIIILLSSCSIMNQEPEIRELNLTFTGDDCIYEGPDEIKAGPVSLAFYNENDSISAMNFMRHKGGESIQDMIDYLGAAPSTKHHPDWTDDFTYYTWKKITSGTSITFDFELEPGIYSMVCAQILPYGVWFGTGLIVQE